MDRCTDADRPEVSDARGSVSDEEHPLAPIGGWRLTLADGRLWFSPEVYAMLGVDPTDFAASIENLNTLLDPETAERLQTRRASLKESVRAFADRYWITRPDGRSALLDVRGWSVDDAQPPLEMFGTCRDVTQVNALREERERLVRREATILDAAGEGICGLDPEGAITFTNPALLRLLRREGEDLIGRSLHELVHRDGDGRQTHSASACPYHAHHRQPVSATDPEFHRVDGSRIEVGYMLVGLSERGARGAVVSFRDFTARRAAARLLQSSLRQVQTLSAQRGALLGHLAEAEERERLRIAADIHDDTIQTLNAVGLRLASAGERVSGDAERDVLADAEIEVREVAERLRRMIFELMPPDERRDLREAVQTYCSVLFADGRMSVELVGDVGPLSSERSRVAYRLVQEALRNARAHSRGSRVEISFELADGELLLRVSDDGIGMGDRATPPEHAGLRIVRRRAEAAGGSARFGPGLDGRGSSIELRLPMTTEVRR